MKIEINNKFNVNDTVFICANNIVFKTTVEQILINHNKDNNIYQLIYKCRNAFGETDTFSQKIMFETKEEAEEYRKDYNVSNLYKYLQKYSNEQLYNLFGISDFRKKQFKEIIPENLHDIIDSIFQFNKSIHRMYSKDGLPVSQKYVDCSFLKGKNL